MLPQYHSKAAFLGNPSCIRLSSMMILGVEAEFFVAVNVLSQKPTGVLILRKRLEVLFPIIACKSTSCVVNFGSTGSRLPESCTAHILDDYVPFLMPGTPLAATSVIVAEVIQNTIVFEHHMI